MEPFKNLYNKNTISKISKEIKRTYPEFNHKKFVSDCLTNLETMELKQRVKHIANTLHHHLPNNYKKSIKIIISSLADEKHKDDMSWDKQAGEGIIGFNTWPLTEYVSIYGLDDYKTSFKAMTELTKRFSSEFAVRPFIELYQEQIYEDFDKLIKHKNKDVRRWISEGTRPLLPWGIKVKNIHGNLERNIELLMKLFKDDEKYVRLSVANHLNDISKLNSKLVLNTCKKMLQQDNSKNTTWIVKHATRSLLKKGNREALVMNGYEKSPKISTSSFKISKRRIKEGDRFNLSMSLNSIKEKDQKLLIEYIIHYPKKNGKLSPKPFRLKDFILKANDKIRIDKEIHFKKVTTRVHYLGQHIIEIQINGKKYGRAQFTLIE